MTPAKKLAQPEFREKVTASILNLLANLPETHKDMFIWKHYHGWPDDVIASVLGCSPSDVEAILLEIGHTLLRRTEAILRNQSDTLPELLEPEELYASCHSTGLSSAALTAPCAELRSGCC